ncbi:MAG: META domain-containing protein [Proteobacteria bacterium]|nr:META domain-containing protein [Desulfobacula sp.]MBU3952144.1 META domain-containing protein [Pseudomonadota bacterium]MBU4130527.1 META domain-containing protein [Pseudomonadota bacterium]
MNKSFFLLILFFCIVSCTGSRNSNTQVIHHLSLFNAKWNLVEINQIPVNISDAAKHPHIQFSEKEMKATGNNGCNSFFTKINTIEERLSFGPVSMTRMACREWMANEMAFLSMLQASHQYTIDGYTLLIMDEKGQVVGKFIAAN